MGERITENEQHPPALKELPVLRKTSRGAAVNVKACLELVVWLITSGAGFLSAYPNFVEA